MVESKHGSKELILIGPVAQLDRASAFDWSFYAEKKRLEWMQLYARNPMIDYRGQFAGNRRRAGVLRDYTLHT